MVKNMSHIIVQLVIVLASIHATFAQFKVFQNSLDPGDFGDSSAGAILEEPGGDDGIPAILDGFTLCMRFQLKVLGSRTFGERGMVANIGDM